MRQETQQRDKIIVLVEIISAGTGLTGLSPIAVLKRVSDGKFWSGSAWQVASANLAMTEVDDTDQPGLYRYALPAIGFDAILGADGYEAMVVEATQNVRQHIFIDVMDEVSEVALDFVSLLAVNQDSSLSAQKNTSRRVGLIFKTDPPTYGKPLGFSVQEAVLSIGSTAHDLISDGETISDFVESALGSATTASVTSDPTLGTWGVDSLRSATVPVDDSSALFDGDYVRASGKAIGEGHVYEILEVPDAFSIVVWLDTLQPAKFDIADGDTIEKVTPSGVYTGYLDLTVNDYLDSTTPSASLIVTGEAVVEDKAPGFPTSEKVTWHRVIELDLSGRGFRAG